MNTVQIITQFAGNGGAPATAYHPAVADAYTFAAWVDITGLPTSEIIPGPNLYVIEATMTPETLAALEADPNYYVLWSE